MSWDEAGNERKYQTIGGWKLENERAEGSAQ